MTREELAYIQAYYYACGRNEALIGPDQSARWIDPSLFADTYKDKGVSKGCSISSWWDRFEK